MSDEKVADLEKRVVGLESYFKVGLIVAAVFGIGGGFGAAALNSARTEISSLRDDVSTAEAQLETVVASLSDAVGEHLESLDMTAARHLDAMSASLNAAERRIGDAVGDAIDEQLAPTLLPRIDAIEDAMAQHQVLAVVTVFERELVEARSSQGVGYNPTTGVVTFRNPERSDYVVVLSDFGTIRSDLAYRTQTNFLRTFENASTFRVWSTTLDTGDRNAAPDGFTALVLEVN